MVKTTLFLAVLVLARAFALFAQPNFTKITAGPLATDSWVSISSNWIDFDNDGDLDLFRANFGSEHVIYENNGDGSFVARTIFQFSEANVFHFQGTWGDYDNDSDSDLYVSTSPNNQLYRNNGDGSFTLITVMDPKNWTGV